MNPAHQAAMDWQTNAIAECRKDPKLLKIEAEDAFCIECMMHQPCICSWRSTLREMRDFYEQNRRIERMGFFYGTWLVRQEPVLEMSWGAKGDGLMDGLYRIVEKQFREEIARLHRKIAALNPQYK